ncbi:MAG: efflux transporter outer membrane subunit [Dokdonella sp.]
MRRLSAVSGFSLRSRGHLARAVLPMALLAALAGCAVGPQFTSPDAPADAGFRKDALPAQTGAVDGVLQGDAQRFIEATPVQARWWTTFKNPELDRRVDLALANSPTIAAAEAALRQAQANVDAARGGLFPSVDAKAGANRSKSALGLSGSGNTTPDVTTTSASAYTIYNAGVSVSYAPDFFGGVRRGVEAQQALADAQRYQLGATYLTLASNVATTSFREASLREQIRSNEDIIGLLREQLDLVQRQFDVGAISMGDVLQSRAQIASAQAQLPALRQQLAETQTQLAVYLGQTPASAELSALSLDAIALPTDIPVSLASELVRQRPDIRAAEAQLHRATAQVGVATANLFPQISLSGSWGTQAVDGGSDLFGSGTSAWSLGLNLLQPIFRGGTLRAQKRAAEAGLDQASASYRNTVLTAFQNVADSLRALELDAESLAAQAEAEQATASSLDLVKKQYRDGSIDYLQVLDSTRLYQRARLALIAARAARLADTAALYASLGGGWQPSDTSMQASTAQ